MCISSWINNNSLLFLFKFKIIIKEKSTHSSTKKPSCKGDFRQKQQCLFDGYQLELDDVDELDQRLDD